MHLFKNILSSGCDQAQRDRKTACKVEKMFESHNRLCKFEICFLRVGSVGSVNDNGVTKLRKIA